MFNIYISLVLSSFIFSSITYILIYRYIKKGLIIEEKINLRFIDFFKLFIVSLIPLVNIGIVCFLLYIYEKKEEMEIEIRKLNRGEYNRGY